MSPFGRLEGEAESDGLTLLGEFGGPPGAPWPEAFTANAFFTAGMVLFEVPTGVVADTRGRRASYLLGTATLLVSTLLYLIMWQTQAPFLGP